MSNDTVRTLDQVLMLGIMIVVCGIVAVPQVRMDRLQDCFTASFEIGSLSAADLMTLETFLPAE